MGHCINIYLINKHELRNDKIDAIINDNIISDDIKWTELEEGILATTYIKNIREYGKNKTIAKISTDYFAGWGNQSAKLFINNKKVYDKVDHIGKAYPINNVLKQIGVIAKNNMDEFDTIGLSKYRSNDFFK